MVNLLMKSGGSEEDGEDSIDRNRLFDAEELLDCIRKAAISGEVVKALLLCQELGGDAERVELSEWARHELEGYPLGAYPPDYRRVRGTLRGDGAAPGHRVRAVAIPIEALPEAQREEFKKGIPLWNPISEIAEMTKQELVGWTPAHMGEMLDSVNSSNASLVAFDMLYVELHGAALEVVLAAVRSQIVGLVTKLRSSSSADGQLDPAAVQTTASGPTTGPVLTVTGDNNLISVGDSGDVNVSAAADGGSSAKPTRPVWRWLKQVLEVVTGIVTVVAFLGDCSASPF